MLEEALKDDRKGPAEVALAMLSYVQQELPNGGTAAENRFYTNLYLPLCDRIFGPIIVDKDDKNIYCHKDGGWLSQRSQWNRNPHGQMKAQTSTLHSPGKSNKPTTIESDPVVRFLGTAGKPNANGEPLPITLIETISKESINRPNWGVALHFDALPKSLRDAWLSTLDSPMMGDGGHAKRYTASESTSQLLTYVLRRGPREQKDLIGILHRKSQSRQHLSMKLSPRGFQGSLSSPTNMYSPKSPMSTGEESKDGVDMLMPKVILGMLEHFLFVFLRFPMAKAEPKYAVSTPGMHAVQKEPYGNTVYYTLFRRYMLHFLPYEREENRSISLPPESRESELFLRLFIAMWMETQGSIKTTSQVMETAVERQRRSGIADLPFVDLDASYDMVQAKFDPPLQIIQRCIRSVIVHIVLDPAIKAAAVKQNDWFITRSMQTMQQSFLNYVRITFRHASIHHSRSPFFSAMDSWLVWLEPWNVNEPKKRDFAPGQIIANVRKNQVPPKRTLSLPTAKAKSRYTPDWEPYIAANLHLYVVPLAIFLRRARELDFSANKMHTSIKVIERVFRVFTPQVVDALSRHLSGSSQLRHLVQRHEQIIGPYTPPSGRRSLSSCQRDMKALLEEIFMQQLKKKDFGLIESCEAWFQTKVSGEEKETAMVLERAKMIVQLPLDYAPQLSTQAATIPVEEKESRLLQNGMLTDDGYQKILTGASKLDAGDVSFVGDKSSARLASHELQILVDAAACFSAELYRRTGRQVDFRPLADYRNLFAVILFIWLFFRIFI